MPIFIDYWVVPSTSEYYYVAFMPLIVLCWASSAYIMRAIDLLLTTSGVYQGANIHVYILYGT